MFLKNFDVISESNCIYYNGNRRHVSKIGGILSIISYISILSLAVHFIMNVINRRNPTSYFYKKFIPDVGILYLNSTMFHYVELLDQYDEVLMDEQSLTIFGTETYIDKFLSDFDISEESHWNYGLCYDNDYNEYKSINEDSQFLKAWCVKGFWNASTKEYFSKENENYIPPNISHGTGSKHEKNMGYGIYIAKCQNTSFRNICKTTDEINEEIKKLLRVKVSIVNNNFDVSSYKNPISSYFIDVKNHLTGKTITQNNLNFNPVTIQTNDGLIFNNNKTIKSYSLDFNEKIIYERGNSTVISGWYFLITNLCETYTRIYPKVHELMANVGGGLKAFLLIAQIINFLFNKWVIIMDIQYECEKLGLEYSIFRKNQKYRRKSFSILKNNNINLILFENDNNNKDNKISNIYVRSRKTHFASLVIPNINKANNNERKSKLYNNNLKLNEDSKNRFFWLLQQSVGCCLHLGYGPD